MAKWMNSPKWDQGPILWQAGGTAACLHIRPYDPDCKVGSSTLRFIGGLLFGEALQDGFPLTGLPFTFFWMRGKGVVPRRFENWLPDMPPCIEIYSRTSVTPYCTLYLPIFPERVLWE